MVYDKSLRFKTGQAFQLTLDKLQQKLAGVIVIRNLLINRGDYAVVKYLTEDLELGNSTHVAAALANRYVLLCTCLCIGCVTHFILDLNNRYVLPFTYRDILKYSDTH
jgi:hypothetical protein